MPSLASPVDPHGVSSATVRGPTPSALAHLLHEWSRDAVLLILCVAVMGLARGILMASLWPYAGPLADRYGVITALIRGFPFDLRTSMLFLLPTVVFSLTALRWPLTTARKTTRVVLGTFFLTSLTLLTLIDHYYFIEYANQFDHFVIGFIYDDTTAILKTVWQQYPIGWGMIAVVLGTLGYAWSLNNICRWQPISSAWFAQRSHLTSGLCVVVALALIVASARGSISRLPAQSKNVAVTADDKLLNKMILNPFACLVAAFTDFRDKRADGAGYAAQQVRSAAQSISGSTDQHTNLDAYFIRTARGTTTSPPKHIVLLLMESYSAWALADRYRALGLAENLRGFAADGISCERFLPEGGGTIYSVGPLLTGLPGAGPMQSYQPLAKKTFPTSLAPIFNRLGYRTRFFYSGYLSWQLLGDFVTNQGFDEVHGGGVISDWTSGNEWGVDDAQLLTYAAKHQRDSTPTFDVILTTSNHPPYSVDVYKAGFPHRTMPKELAGIADATADLAVLGHLWFSDQALGSFIERLQKAQPDTLFIITGDHYGRRFINRSPDPWERTAVPGIFYGPAVAHQRLRATAGSHLDLLPTLVELCAPAGFTYHAIGVDLFNQEQPTAITTVGAVSTTAAIEWNNRSDAVGVTPEDLLQWQKRKSERSAVGWWRLMKGPQLPLEEVTPAARPAAP